MTEATPRKQVIEFEQSEMRELEKDTAAAEKKLHAEVDEWSDFFADQVLDQLKDDQSLPSSREEQADLARLLKNVERECLEHAQQLQTLFRGEALLAADQTPEFYQNLLTSDAVHPGNYFSSHGTELIYRELAAFQTPLNDFDPNNIPHFSGSKKLHQTLANKILATDSEVIKWMTAAKILIKGNPQPQLFNTSCLFQRESVFDEAQRTEFEAKIAQAKTDFEAEYKAGNETRRFVRF